MESAAATLFPMVWEMDGDLVWVMAPLRDKEAVPEGERGVVITKATEAILIDSLNADFWRNGDGFGNGGGCGNGNGVGNSVGNGYGRGRGDGGVDGWGNGVGNGGGYRDGDGGKFD